MILEFSLQFEYFRYRLIYSLRRSNLILGKKRLILEFSLQFGYLQYHVIYPLRKGNLILEKKR